MANDIIDSNGNTYPDPSGGFENQSMRDFWGENSVTPSGGSSGYTPQSNPGSGSSGGEVRTFNPEDYYGNNSSGTWGVSSGWSGLGTPSPSNVTVGSPSSGSRTVSGGGTTLPTSTSTTTTRTPTVPMPTLAKTTPYSNPTWSAEQIKAYSQEDSALGISEARDALYNSVNKIVSMQGNPTAQAAAMRDALKGHGGSIAQIMRGANKEALARYQMMYQNQINEAMTRFNTGQTQTYTKYQAEMQAYLNSMKQVTNNTTSTAPATGGGMYNPNATYGAPSGG